LWLLVGVVVVQIVVVAAVAVVTEQAQGIQ
jgi:hypothetical protein